MSDFLDHNTPRLRVTYVYPFGTHRMLFRCADNTHVSDMVNAAHDLFIALRGYFGEAWHTAQAEVALAGSDLFFPELFTPVTGSDTTIVYDDTYVAARALEVLGRDTAGSKVNWSFYGSKQVFNRQMRLPNSGGMASAFISAFATAIGSLAFTTISQNPPVLKDYVNLNMNDKVQRDQRG